MQGTCPSPNDLGMGDVRHDGEDVLLWREDKMPAKVMSLAKVLKIEGASVIASIAKVYI